MSYLTNIYATGLKGDTCNRCGIQFGRGTRIVEVNNQRIHAGCFTHRKDG